MRTFTGERSRRHQELKRQGLSIRAISQVTGIDRQTIAKYLNAPGIPLYGPQAV